MPTTTLVKSNRTASRRTEADMNFVMPPLHFAWEQAPAFARLEKAPLKSPTEREILTLHQFIAWHAKLSSRRNSNSVLPT